MACVIEPSLAASRDAVAALCRAHGVNQLEVFGSAADGRFDSHNSDYHFIVRVAARPERSLARRYVEFAEALERLLGRPVNLMTDHPIENPYLRRAVEASRQLVFRDETAEASLGAMAATRYFQSSNQEVCDGPR